MSNIHFSLDLSPHEPNERKLLEFLHLQNKSLVDGKIGKSEFLTEIKHLLLSGYYIHRMNSNAPARLAHMLGEDDLSEFISKVLGIEGTERVVERVVTKEVPVVQKVTLRDLASDEGTVKSSLCEEQFDDVDVNAKPDMSLDQIDAYTAIGKSKLW